MPTLEFALLLDLVCRDSIGRRLLQTAVETFEYNGKNSGPNTIVLRGAQLQHLRNLYDQGETSVRHAITHLVASARSGVSHRVETVRDKPGLQPDAPNDYVSLAKYWWPKNENAENTTYVRRDGHVNPDCFSENYDYGRWTRLSNDVFSMALASYLASDRELGSAAANKIGAWFLHPSTAQTPHFEYAQTVPDRKELTARGLIEVRYLSQVIEAIEMLVATGDIDEETHKRLQGWFAKLLSWLLNSEKGRKAAGGKNNITVWYFSSCYVIASFLGDDDRATDLLKHQMDAIAEQIDTDGSIPVELERNRPHDYTAFSLLGVSLIEAAASQKGVDPLTTEVEAGKALTAARDWLGATAESMTARHTMSKLADAGEQKSKSSWPAELDILLLARVLKNTRDALKKPEALAHIRQQPTAAELQRDQAIRERDKALDAYKLSVRERKKLKRRANLLTIPYIVLLAPIAMPWLLVKELKSRRKKQRGQAKRN